MTDTALNAVVLVVAIFAVLHYLTLRTILLGRGIFERRDEEPRDQEQTKILRVSR